MVVPLFLPGFGRVEPVDNVANVVGGGLNFSLAP